MIDKIFYCFMFLILLILKPGKFEYFSSFYNFSVSLILFLLVVFFLLWHRRFDKNWLRFDVLFLIGYTIVHIQIPFLASVGIEPIRPYFVWINKDVVNYATWMSVVAINLWMLGYSVYLKKPKAVTSKEYKIVSKSYSIIDTIILISFIGFLSTAGSVLLSGVYDLDSWGAQAVYFLLVLSTLIYLRIVYFFSELKPDTSYRQIIKKAFNNKIFIFVLFVYLGMFFLVGDRGEVLKIVLMIAFSYSAFVKSISFKSILLSVVIGSFLFTIIGLGRINDLSENDNRNILERGYSALNDREDKPNFTNELASSVRIQYRALDTVPLREPYLDGRTYLVGLFSVIPFASGFIVDTFEIDRQYLSSSNYFTYLGQGLNPTYGEGSEILGDIYINFGIYGVFIIMFLFGLMSGKFYHESKQFKMIYILLYSILLIAAIRLNRASLFELYKIFFYIIIFHFIFKKSK